MINISSPSKNKTKIDQQYLKDIVEKISFPRPFGSKAHHDAGIIVAKEFADIFDVSPKLIGQHNNIYAGAEPDEAEIIIGAHYDSVPNCPAADDNASAVAVMLACAKELKNHKNICFIAFNCEEFGIAGSQDLVENHIPKSNKLKHVHVLEMVGYRSFAPNSQKNPLPGMIDAPTTGDFIGVVGNNEKFIKEIVAKADTVNIPVVSLALPKNVSFEQINYLSPHLLRSDHIGFWESNIPAVMWTDTAEFRNKNYHQPTDTPDTLDYEFMAEVTQLIVNLYKE